MDAIEFGTISVTPLVCYLCIIESMFIWNIVNSLTYIFLVDSLAANPGVEVADPKWRIHQKNLNQIQWQLSCKGMNICRFLGSHTVTSFLQNPMSGPGIKWYLDPLIICSPNFIRLNHRAGKKQKKLEAKWIDQLPSTFVLRLTEFSSHLTLYSLITSNLTLPVKLGELVTRMLKFWML